MAEATSIVRGWLSRNFAFDTRANVVRACVVACALAAMVSLLLGQDANADLRNYHLYNGWAALYSRLSIDLAPAQMQSYFVPWLDVGYYLVAVKGSAMLAGIVLGAWHGLVFAAVAAVAWQVLEGDQRRSRLVPMLAFAGCCSAVFLAELGNTMGDNTTAPLVLAAVALTIRAVKSQSSATLHWLVAGLLLGLALGLKLTNAIYALGLGVAVLTGRPGWRRRFADATLLTVVTTIVFGVVAGPWFFQVWSQFGNPLFPQFNTWFQAPLAQPIGVADLRWLPDGVLQAVLWPIWITLNPREISESAMPQLAWAALYLLGIAAAFIALMRRFGPGRSQPSAPVGFAIAERMLLVFVAVSFLAWMWMFSIHRYLAALEALAPLAIWLLALRVFPAASARQWGARIVTACVFVAVLGWNTWGNNGWDRHGFFVETPPMRGPERATVLLVGGYPQAWRVPFLPAKATYASVGTNFPASPAYSLRVNETIAERGGEIFAMFPAEESRFSARLVKINRWAKRLGLTSGDCGVLGRFAKPGRFELRAAVGDVPCQLVLAAAAEEARERGNQALIHNASELLRAHGLSLRPGSCAVLDSRIGDEGYPFRWCEVERSP
ncbi:hypothetical protein [Silanimonas sp.]|uniref:hypothetical protein n=1 Tax=Silanimonas sp. TaxID=1929290 RepID=UPI0022BB606B|nr:hypothetical protein [Silanimonas sp.]MCZ8165750.1 hypothetical protein [Silanimonas sp.]